MMSEKVIKCKGEKVSYKGVESLLNKLGNRLRHPERSVAIAERSRRISLPYFEMFRLRYRYAQHDANVKYLISQLLHLYKYSYILSLYKTKKSPQQRIASILR